MFCFEPKEGDSARPQHYTHPGLAASDGSGADGARLLVPTENFGDAAVGNPQLPGDHAGPDAVVSHLHDFMTDVVGQRSAVDEHPSELVHPALAQRGGNWRVRGGIKSKQNKERKRSLKRGEKPSKTERIPHPQLRCRYLKL